MTLHRRFSYAWFAHAVRERGLLATVRAAPLFGAKLVRMWRWDRTHHVRTRQRVFANDLGLTGPSAPHATAYEASDTTVLPRLLSQLSFRAGRYVFVDLGAGKGRALFLAAECPFKRIVGVELSPALYDIALRNCRTFRSPTQACTQIEMIRGDAADFEFPDDPLVVYIFNPFDEAVLSRVLARLAKSLEDHPREAWLIYHHPRHRALVDESGAFAWCLTGTDRKDFRKIGYEVYRGIYSNVGSAFDTRGSRVASNGPRFHVATHA